MANLTANYGWTKPVVGGDGDAWGGEINADLDSIDSTVKSVSNAIPVASSTSPVMDGAAAVGVGTTWARADHVHPVDTSRYAASNPSGFQTAAQVTAAVPVASSTTPVMDGAAAVGAGTTWARADHVHPTDTSRYAATNPSGFQTAAQVTTSLAPYAPLASPAFTGTPSMPTGTTGVTQTAGNSSTALATTAFVTTAVPVASSTTPSMDGTATVGAGTTWARSDHVHPSDTTKVAKTGVTDGSDAPAGQIGEVISSINTTPVNCTINAAVNIASIVLTPGDWDVSGELWLVMPAAAAATRINAAINTVSGTLPTAISMTTARTSMDGTFPISSTGNVLSLATVRANVTVSTTYILVAGITGSSGTGSATGKIWARRAR